MAKGERFDHLQEISKLFASAIPACLYSDAVIWLCQTESVRSYNSAGHRDLVGKLISRLCSPGVLVLAFFVSGLAIRLWLIIAYPALYGGDTVLHLRNHDHLLLSY